MSQTGRNDPCPCGSGKEYKNGCLRKDEEAQQAVWQKEMREVEAPAVASIPATREITPVTPNPVVAAKSC
jgi:hypothetical protein